MFPCMFHHKVCFILSHMPMTNQMQPFGLEYDPLLSHTVDDEDYLNYESM